ncbi:MULTISPECIES: GNAT family N-acetyltransferase [unclassified Burkholderia]|uniref:GNAT family N-acetyltransferase n=1 Tax=unclassified Burkholderia TaxID=2613784 RepID=UPI001FC7D2FF|nr:MULTISPECIES: GNAT family N-acetyltransferase [unclassified Burkholderia]
MRFRRATEGDAYACAPLIFASGTREFGFFLGATPDQCIAFLKYAFASRFGRFSWRRHRVAVTLDGTVCAVMASHDGRVTGFDDFHVVWMLLAFFGPSRTIRALLRGLVLESELPSPKRRQTLIAHCATDECMRGMGVFSLLFEHALRSGVFAATEDRDVVLDVLVSNTGARTLYERLGFVEMSRSYARSQRLPVELASVRMRLVRKDGDDRSRVAG